MAFVRNAWYVAAYGREVDGAPLVRNIAGDPILFFREPGGRLAALLDVCPHRFAPLSAGTITAGTVQCGYHGLKFNASGVCTHNPHGKGAIPRTLAVRTFPVVERDDLIWLWAGDPALADEQRVPDCSFLVDPQRRTLSGYTRIASSYRLMVDNLTDLGHAQYLHGSNFATDAFGQLRRLLTVDRDRVTASLTIPDGTTPAIWKRLLDFPDQRVNMWLDTYWFAVSSLVTVIGIAPVGTPKEQNVNTKSAHLLTPETETSHHYFFSNSRNFRLDDADVDQMLLGWQQQALVAEDAPMVEAIEQRSGVANRYGLTPTMLACDEASVRVGRIIEELLAAEAAAAMAF
jgi:vanillate O-demethylase monooxygenase subunit